MYPKNSSVLWVKKIKEECSQIPEECPIFLDGLCLFFHRFFLLGMVILMEHFIEVGSSSDWGFLTPNGNERICSEYCDCTILFYECIFLVLVICPPFTTFEIKVLKHLVMAPS